ncbi:exopolyphosphatase [bacterium]|nr:exopolyphosphatase [bacterium]
MNLITRANLDGVTCAVLVTKIEPIDNIIFAEPKDLEDGSIDVMQGDIITNLPLHSNAGTWFDHHDLAEEERSVRLHAKGKRGIAPSAARLVYEYYDTPELKQYADLVTQTDKFDSADLSIDDVLNPEGWMQIGFTIDPFMGKDILHEYARLLTRKIRKDPSPETILALPEVQNNIHKYKQDAETFKERVEYISRVDGNVIITDARQAELLPIGNRFISFALFPDQNVQITLTTHKEKSKIRVRIGKSIFNRTCNVHLGQLLAEYGGGGLEGAAGFLLDKDRADIIIKEIVERLKNA